MKKILNTFLVLLPIVAASQTQTENYIKTTTYKVPSTTSITNPGSTQADQNVTYFDGLGRPVQQVAHQQSGSGKDIVTPIEYDAFGRQAKDYLPYVPAAAASLDYKTPALTEVGTFYNTTAYENTSNPYSQKEFEASPLNRVLKQAAPGDDWKLGNGHEIRLDYQTNTNADQVRRFEVSFIGNNTENPYLEDEGIYDPSQLYKTVTKDENWQPGQTNSKDHTTEEFKDKEGRVIVKRTFDAGKWHDTYYVYDDFGNLTYVLPPKVLTYTSITQPYFGQYFYGDSDNQGISFFIDDEYAELNLSQQNEGLLSYYLYAYGLTPGSSLKSGKITNLDFTPTLPDMTLGNIMVSDINGNPVVGGTAYIQNGEFYFSSTGVGVYPDENGDFFFSNVINLSDFQASYAPQALDRSTLNDLIYQYRYDKRNRLVEKKLPGKEWEFIVYDKLDRPILTQDANLKAQNKWLFTKYDAFGRVAYTGFINNTGSRTNLQTQAETATSQNVAKSSTAANIAGTDVYYSNDANVYPVSNIAELYTINYYDDYSFDNDGLVLPATSLGIDIINYNNTAQNLTKGLLTGTKIRILESSPVAWITTVSGYDDKGRAIYNAKKNNYLFTTDALQNKLDFIGKIEKTITTHTKKTAINGTVVNTVSTEDIFTYDQAGRLLKQTQTINGAVTPEIILANTYDELGQLISKKVGGKTIQGLQKVDYAYNIRGWLTNINDPNNLNQDNDLFGFGLNYNTIVNPSLASYYQNKPLYNGNISSTSWKSSSVNPVLKQYNYTYDALNRFKNANYIENNVFNYKYNETISEYDRNGNIMSLSRNMQNPGANSWYTSIDQLTYTYNKGNRLMKVDDNTWNNAYRDEGFKDTNTGSDDYSYDDNGNMIIDKNKAIVSIAYNYLNLPVKINFNTGKSISYAYDATGAKQSKKVISSGTTTTDYAGGFQYENNILKFFPQPEGYVEYKSGNFNYIYQYKDHLGNIRLSYTDSNNDGIIAPPVSTIYQTIWEDGFESNTNWNSTEVEWLQPLAAFDSTVKHSGNRSGRVDMNSYSSISFTRMVQNNQWTAINNTVDTQYRISGWIFIENVTKFTRGRLDLLMKNEGETNYTTLIDYAYTDAIGQWVFLQKTITVPASIKYLNMRLTLEINEADYSQRNIWYDDLKIEKIIENTQNEIIVESSYYPFGLEHNNGNNIITSTSAGYKYKYNGKELQDELGLNMYDYGARNYEPALGRWMNVDPLAEKYPETSPYVYVANNPIVYIDPDGRELILSFASAGAMTSYSNIVNSALGGKYQANLVAIAGTSNYRVEISTINSKTKITSEQKAFYNQLNKVVTADEVVNQSVVENDANVVVDSWQTNQIDIKDVEAFDAAGTGAATSAGALTHSHIEQLEKAKKGLNSGDLGATKTDSSGNTTYTDYTKSHNKAIKAENKVNGNKRIEDGSGTDIFKEKNRTKTSQTVTPTATGSVTITKAIVP